MANGVPSEEISGVAYGALKELGRSFTRYRVDLPADAFTNAIVDTLSQHRAHLEVHRVDQTHVDPYKVVCWCGCAVLKLIDESENFERAATAIVRLLGCFLQADSNGEVVLPPRTYDLLVQMLREEKMGTCNHGIWQNGLYAAFHSAVAVMRCYQDPKSRLENL